MQSHCLLLSCWLCWEAADQVVLLFLLLPRLLRFLFDSFGFEPLAMRDSSLLILSFSESQSHSWVLNKSQHRWERGSLVLIGDELCVHFSQLRAEVGCLQGELEGKHAEMETLDTLLQRRERESQEGGNLLKMLTEDLQIAKEERYIVYF